VGTQNEVLGSMTASVTIYFHCMEWRCNASEWWPKMSVSHTLLKTFPTEEI